MIRPIKKGISFFLLGMIAIYLVLCVWDGFAWSTQISPTYGLQIIRLIVVAGLAIINALLLPFRAGSFLIFTVINSAILFPFIGLLHGLSLNLDGEDLMIGQKNNATITFLFVISIGILVFSYGNAILNQRFIGLIHVFILSDIKITGPCIFILFLWIGRNIYYTIRSRQSN